MDPIVAAVRPWFSSKQFSYLILLLLGLGNKAVSIESVYFHSSAPQPYREVPQDTSGAGKIVEHLFQVKQQSVFQPQLELQLGSGNAADCPASNNETYYTSNGVFFVVLCTKHNWNTVISMEPAASLQECIDKCGREPTCKSVNYQFTSDYECFLQSDQSALVDDCPNHHYAYQIDPPTQPAPDEDLIVCSTSCPTGMLKGQI